MNTPETFDVAEDDPEGEGIDSINDIINLTTPGCQKIVDFVRTDVAPDLQATPLCHVALMMATIAYYKAMHLAPDPHSLVEAFGWFVDVTWDGMTTTTQEPN